MRVITAFTSLLLLSFFGASGQVVTQNLIKGLTEYRSSILVENAEEATKLKDLMLKWSTLETEDDEILNIQNYLVHYKIHFLNLSNSQVIEKIQRDFPTSKIAKEMTVDEVRICLANLDLIDMIKDGILKGDFPFQINIDQTSIDMLSSMDLGENMTIGEIGAGDGTFSLMLGLLGLNLNIYVNELKDTQIAYISRKLNAASGSLDVGKFKVVQGYLYGTNFPEASFDRILVFNTLHHFKYPKDMLASIKENLKSDGLLLIEEYPVELDQSCPKHMKEKDIYKVLRRAGFELVDKLSYENAIFLKFRIKAE
jgi:SAM-dependent methyltransferase